jgi:hypothetical protein
MTNPPHEVQLTLDEYDRSQLPEARRDLSGDAFREAMTAPETTSGSFSNF